MSCSNIPSLAQKKHTCDLKELLDELAEVNSDKAAFTATDQYDAFIFKDGFTQSSYTFHKLKGTKNKSVSRVHK